MRPPFHDPHPLKPLTLDVLRAFWRTRTDNTSRALLEEIGRLHQLLRDIENTRQVIDDVWREERRGQLIALLELKALLVYEPALQYRPPPPRLVVDRANQIDM